MRSPICVTCWSGSARTLLGGSESCCRISGRKNGWQRRRSRWSDRAGHTRVARSRAQPGAQRYWIPQRSARNAQAREASRAPAARIQPHVPRRTVSMSQRERDVLKVMSAVPRRERTQSEAAWLLRKSERQVRRLQRRLEAEGDAGIVHRLRGRASNRQLNHELRAKVLELYQEELADFGPTLASEVMSERGLEVSADTLRRWLTADGLWQRQRQRDQHRSRRPRRSCFGELVQMDASLHSWLEGRGEEMVLVCMIDDATNRVMARFYPGETVEAYFDLVGRWLAKYGRPMAFYTDHDSIFEIASPGKQIQAMTQFERAMSELKIELILAGSPQAKGRVERSHGTMQDRWVKLLRLAGVTTREEANQYIDKKLLPDHNRRFSKPAASPNDSYRPL